MRAVMLQAPEGLLEERRRLGHDRWDEVWDGVLHMVPPPSDWHQRFGTQLLIVLGPMAQSMGLQPSYETGLFHPERGERDFRVPDLIFTRPGQRSERGVEAGAELLVELLSPHDESREKLSFYAEVGVTEVWLIDPRTRHVELYVLRGGAYLAVPPDSDGTLKSTVLPAALRPVDGPRLRVSLSDEVVEI